MRIETRRLGNHVLALVCMLPLVIPSLAQTDTASLVNRLKAYRFGTDKSLFDNVAQAVTQSRGDPSQRVRSPTRSPRC